MQRRPWGFWTKERCTEHAAKYATLDAMQKAEPELIHTLRAKGWLRELCPHINFTASVKWSFESCAEEAAKFTCRSDFFRNSHSAYEIARRKGWLNTICAHMIRPFTKRKRKQATALGRALDDRFL